MDVEKVSVEKDLNGNQNRFYLLERFKAPKDALQYTNVIKS